MRENRKNTKGRQLEIERKKREITIQREPEKEKKSESIIDQGRMFATTKICTSRKRFRHGKVEQLGGAQPRCDPRSRRVGVGSRRNQGGCAREGEGGAARVQGAEVTKQVELITQ